jgi:magnesium transporter
MTLNTLSHFNLPVLDYARPYGTLLRKEMTVGEALDAIREGGMDERIIYFYVVDDQERLAGVLPTRRLLTSPLGTKLGEVMIGRVLAVPATATLLDACDLFVLHKFLALPVIDENRRIVGVLDIAVFTEEMLELPAEPDKADDLFEALGFHLSQVRGASATKAFRFRFPWLLATIASGTLAAVIAGAYQTTLSKHVVVSCFLALVLALGEAVTVQSLTLTLQALRTSQPTRRWFLESLRREGLAALLLGAACGALAYLIVWVGRGTPASREVVGLSAGGGLIIACFSGLAVPSLLRAFKLDPKIAAGPAALALTDVLTLLLYLSLASRLL